MSNLPKWVQSGQGQWEYRGQKRPDFASTPKENQESVWDYPRPPVLVADNRTIIVKANKQKIAESTNGYRVLETASPPTVYIPPEDMDISLLTKNVSTSRCEWKGVATYWDIKTDNFVIQKAAWSYEDPFDKFQQIKGYLCFYPGKVSCYLDDERVRPQPGGYYGGWLTDEIVGPVKGESRKTYL